MELETVKFHSFTGCCRLCLEKSHEMYALFTGRSNETNLASLILHLTGINASETDGMRGICAQCYNTICEFMAFRQECQKMNAQLSQTARRRISPVAETVSKMNTIFPATALRNTPALINENDNLDEIQDEDVSSSFEATGHQESDIEESSFEENYTIRKLGKRELSIPKAYYGLCNICGKEYKHLWRHLESHNTVPVDRCKVCGKEFKSKAGLQMHVLMHQDAIYACDQCNKKYRTKNRLKLHYRVHTNDRPFSCATCEKKFYTRYNLEVHSRIHTGAKPYTCQFCGLQFTHSYAVKNHMDRFHLEMIALTDP